MEKLFQLTYLFVFLLLSTSMSAADSEDYRYTTVPNDPLKATYSNLQTSQEGTDCPPAYRAYHQRRYYLNLHQCSGYGTESSLQLLSR